VNERVEDSLLEEERSEELWPNDPRSEDLRSGATRSVEDEDEELKP
jgi:hypothetical protein